MCTKCTKPAKRSATIVALIRFLTVVYSLMSSQIILPRIQLIANVAAQPGVRRGPASGTRSSVTFWRASRGRWFLHDFGRVDGQRRLVVKRARLRRIGRGGRVLQRGHDRRVGDERLVVWWDGEMFVWLQDRLMLRVCVEWQSIRINRSCE